MIKRRGSIFGILAVAIVLHPRMDISFFIIPFKKNLQLDNVQIKYKKKNTYISFEYNKW